MIKKICLWVLIGSMTLLGACTQETWEEPEVLNQQEALYSFEAGFRVAEGRTVLEEGGKVKWKAGDEVVLFNETASARYVALAGGATTLFVLAEGEQALEPTGTYTAFYPADQYDVNQHTFSVKQTQQAVAGSFDPEAALCMATVTNREPAAFVNLCTLLKVNVPQAAIDGKAIGLDLSTPDHSIVSGGKLASDGKVTWNQTVKNFRLNGSFEYGKDYYLVIPPQTLKQGFTLAMKDSKNATIKYCARTHSAAVTFASSRSYAMGTIESVLIDGMDDPENGIVVLQEAKVGKGVDIVLMGDGFAAEHFLNGNYEAVMQQAAEDFFSVEPYTSLRNYFNVYYIHALSEVNHDAVPYYDSSGNQNGATMGNARTKFETQFEPGSTQVSGNIDLVLEYMQQAIRHKGGKGGTPVSNENEVLQRAYTALGVVQINVKCYAGTCLIGSIENSPIDYCNAFSIAFTPLGSDGTGKQCRLTTVHEAGGHGFGKLADEYQGWSFNSFSTSLWTQLKNNHSIGLYRNVNEYWTEEEEKRWNGLSWTYTTEDNVYWAELLRPEYNYTDTEGLSMYMGAYTYDHMFCRPTDNSMMRHQFEEGGQYFNAISRWAIWYRVMKLAGVSSATDFKSSLNEFIAFDSSIQGWKTTSAAAPAMGGENFVEKKWQPLGPPVLIRGEWIDGCFVELK